MCICIIIIDIEALELDPAVWVLDLAALGAATDEKAKLNVGRETIEPLLEHADASHSNAVVDVAQLQSFQHHAFPELHVVGADIFAI